MENNGTNGYGNYVKICNNHHNVSVIKTKTVLEVTETEVNVAVTHLSISGVFTSMNTKEDNPGTHWLLER